jgi:hypothetical protein
LCQMDLWARCSFAMRQSGLAYWRRPRTGRLPRRHGSQASTAVGGLDEGQESRQPGDGETPGGALVMARTCSDGPSGAASQATSRQRMDDSQINSCRRLRSTPKPPWPRAWSPPRSPAEPRTRLRQVYPFVHCGPTSAWVHQDTEARVTQASAIAVPATEVPGAPTIQPVDAIIAEVTQSVHPRSDCGPL